MYGGNWAIIQSLCSVFYIVFSSVGWKFIRQSIKCKSAWNKSPKICECVGCRLNAMNRNFVLEPDAPLLFGCYQHGFCITHIYRFYCYVRINISIKCESDAYIRNGADGVRERDSVIVANDSTINFRYHGIKFSHIRFRLVETNGESLGFLLISYILLISFSKGTDTFV